MSRPTGATHQKKLKKLEDTKKAFLLRISGYSFLRISEEMHCSKAWAHKLINQAMDEYRANLRQTVDELRAIELARLDNMLTQLAVPMSRNDVTAIRAAVRISEHRSSLLGLYPQPAPRQLPDGGSEVIPGLPNAMPAHASVVFYLPDNGRNDAPAYPQAEPIEGEFSRVNGNGSTNGSGH